MPKSPKDYLPMVIPQVPSIPESLLKHLEAIYPDKSPDRSEDLETIRFKSGQISVVRYLRQVLDAQIKKSLTN